MSPTSVAAVSCHALSPGFSQCGYSIRVSLFRSNKKAPGLRRRPEATLPPRRHPRRPRALDDTHPSGRTTRKTGQPRRCRTYSCAMDLVRREARAARAALAALTDERVDEALDRTAELLGERADEILAANAADLAAADLDEGATDRLRLDESRLKAIADGVRATRSLPPIERDVRTWTLANGLVVSERLIPVGVVGANFEARPNVAVDVATQVLKSGNAVVLRTGAAALGTVTVLVDRVVRPALADSG